MAAARQVVVMGVSGSGKSTVAALIAARISAKLADADDFHPQANVAKMRAGRPLDDGDRAPWLAALAGWLAQRAAAGERAVLSCSALRRSYRDVLRAAGTGVVFLHLVGPRELIADRMRQRAGHFMPPELLESQFAALQPLEPDEPGMTLDIRAGGRLLADQAVAYLAATAPPGAG